MTSTEKYIISLDHSLHLFLYFHLSIQLAVNKLCQWLDQNCRSVVLVATSQSLIEPQPIKYDFILVIHFSFFMHSLLENQIITPLHFTKQLIQCRKCTFSATRQWHLPENTHLLRKGKYHCMAGLLFDRLGFGQTSKSVYSFNSTKQLNPNQSSRRSAVQWYFLLWSKWAFSAFAYKCAIQWNSASRKFLLITWNEENDVCDMRWKLERRHDQKKPKNGSWVNTFWVF